MKRILKWWKDLLLIRNLGLILRIIIWSLCCILIRSLCSALVSLELLCCVVLREFRIKGVRIAFWPLWRLMLIVERLRINWKMTIVFVGLGMRKSNNRRSKNRRSKTRRCDLKLLILLLYIYLEIYFCIYILIFSYILELIVYEKSNCLFFIIIEIMIYIFTYLKYN